MRELKEELDIELDHWEFFRQLRMSSRRCLSEHQIYLHGAVDRLPENLTLYEGQRLTSIAAGERRGFNFANILGAILEDFIAAGLWPQPVDKF